MWSSLAGTTGVCLNINNISTNQLDGFTSATDWACHLAISGLAWNFDSGIRSSNLSERATADEDGHYCFAVAL